MMYVPYEGDRGISKMGNLRCQNKKHPVYLAREEDAFGMSESQNYVLKC